MGVSLRKKDLTYYKCGVLVGEPIIRYNKNNIPCAFFSHQQVIINDVLQNGEYEFVSNVTSGLGNLEVTIYRYEGNHPALSYNRNGLSAVGNGVHQYSTAYFDSNWALLCDGVTIDNSKYVYTGWIYDDWVRLPEEGYSYLVGTNFDDEEGYLYLSLAEPRYINERLNSVGNNDSDKQWFSHLMSQYTPSNFPNDPLSGGGTSSVGGTGSGGSGGGTWSAPSDNIAFPNTPTVPDIMKTGLFSAYAMNVQELQSFGNYLWSSDFVDTIKKLLADPMQSIIGVSVFPFDLSTVSGETAPLKVGNVEIETPETAYKINTNMKKISCGTLNLQHYSGNAMDYAPYTKLQIYLPYIGIKELNINDFMNSSISVDYVVDILTGVCSAYIGTVNKVLYVFTGKMSAEIPITNADYSALTSALVNLAGVGAGAVATVATGGGALAGGAITATALSASKVVASSQPNINRSGGFNGHIGMLLLQTPYLIITRPQQSLPQSFNSFKGYPSNITEKLSNLSGYTEVEHVHMAGFSNATKDEILEIEILLKTGVIL